MGVIQVTWLIWTVFTAASLIGYHLTMRGMSQEIGLVTFLLYGGAVSFAAGLVGWYLYPDKVDTSLTIPGWMLLLAVIGTGILVEIGFFQVYQSQGPLSLVQPMVTGIVSASLLAIGLFLLREQIQIQQIFGVLLVVVGVILISLKAKA